MFKNWKRVENINDNDFNDIIQVDETYDYTLFDNQTNDGKRKKKSKPAKSKVQKITSNQTPIVPANHNFDLNDDLNFKWNDFKLDFEIKNSLKLLKFNEPTEIQKRTIECAFQNQNDIIGCAQTGSGKTLAFAVPIVNFIIKRKNNKNPQALILTPTRELAIQISQHIKQITTSTKVECIVGGIAQVKQERLLQSDPHIVIATPGRLWQMMKDGVEGALKITNVRYLVVDEADRMIGKDYYEQFSYIINELNNSPGRSSRRTFVFSATLTFIKNKKGEDDISSKLKTLVEKIGIRKKYTLIDLSNTSFLAENIKEWKICCSKNEKDIYLYYLLSVFTGRAIVFTNSKDCTRRIAAILRILCSDLSISILHADMVQKQRFRNLERFKGSQKKAVLVATDVAARGLDIEDVENVIHYQVSTLTEAYVHRSGRTARGCKSGSTITILSYDEHKKFVRIQNQLKKSSNIANYEIEDYNLFNRLKRRTELAVKIMNLDHLNEKTKKNKDWFEKSAREAELDITNIFENNSNDENLERSKAIRVLRDQLKQI